MVQPQIQRRGTGTCGAFLCPRARREPSPNGLSRAVGPAAGCCQQCPLYWYFSIVRCACHIFGRSLHPILVHITPPWPASCKFNRRDSRFCSPPLALALALCLSLFLSLFLSRSFLSFIPNPPCLCGFHFLLLFLPRIPWVPLASRSLSLSLSLLLLLLSTLDSRLPPISP